MGFADCYFDGWGLLNVAPYQIKRRCYGLTTMWSSTLVIPGADHATRSASSRSIQERTVPFSTTSLPFVSTVIRLASSSAFRLNASWILRLSSEGSTLGFTVMTLVTPLTPFTFRTAVSAVLFW